MKKQLLSIALLFSFSIAHFSCLHAADPGRSIVGQIEQKYGGMPLEQKIETVKNILAGLKIEQGIYQSQHQTALIAQINSRIEQVQNYLERLQEAQINQ